MLTKKILLTVKTITLGSHKNNNVYEIYKFYAWRNALNQSIIETIIPGVGRTLLPLGIEHVIS